MHVTLYRKYRPKSFEEVAGEKDIIKTIKNSLDKDRLAHAYLFNGPRGVGKTTTARLIAKGVNCLENGVSSTPCNKCESCLEIDRGNFVDLIEIDAASNRGIDEIRELKDKINYSPSKGRKKIYIIDEVHMLTKEAFNALLKTLEEPPSHVIFILATTEADKIIPTIISRCQRYDFKTLNYFEVKDKLIEICEKENAQIDEESLKLIYEASGGSMRDANSILERVMISSIDNKISEKETSKIIGITSKKLLEDLNSRIEEKSLKKGVDFLESLWLESIDIEKFFKDFGKFIKDRIVEEKIEIENGMRIIGEIYNGLSNFKYEEDKRLLGYVILNSILKSEKKSEIKEKEIVYIETKLESLVKEDEISIEVLNVNIEEIKRKWDEIIEIARKEKPTYGAFLMGAFPFKISDNELHIGFRENKYSKEQMETDYYNIPFQDIVQRITKSKLRLAYFYKKEQNETTIKKESIVKTEDVLAYFSEV